MLVRLGFLAVFLVLAPAWASAQTVRPVTPAPQVVTAPEAAQRASALQAAADQRWADVFARDAEYMRAVRAAVAAEILVRRARSEDVSVLQRELGRLDAATMSFSMQYLMLQQTMQNESRQYSALSNIMRTKHDTARNALLNIR